MPAERTDRPRPPERETKAVAKQPEALPRGAPQSDTGQPGGGRGRVDVTGIILQDIHVDPDLTEGHPGYAESGGSEIIPPKPLAGGENKPGESEAG
jgi:hypothetical protein